MTGEKSNFLSLTASDGGSVAFENGKSRTIVAIDKIGASLPIQLTMYILWMVYNIIY